MRLVIVGGGAAGTLTAAAASRNAAIDEILLVERGHRAGPGLAYGAAAPHHRLNSPAGRMGAWEDAPGDFVRWSRTVGSTQDDGDYSPRRLYGDYLDAVLGALPRTRVVHAEAIDVVTDETGAEVRLRDGRILRADAAVLALGVPPPPGRGAGAATVVDDPWAPGALDGVRGRVLLVGTGLTMVDVATSLARADPATVMTATSRSGLLPRVHPERPHRGGEGLGAHVRLGDLIREFRQRVADSGSWEAEVDGVRPQVDRLWAALPPADRDRFLRHVSRRWEVHRHRMSLPVARELQTVIDEGRLVLGEPTGAYDAVVDCTGSRAFASRDWNPVVDALLASGTARPDALGMGLDVDPDGRVRDERGAASPRLLAIGLARRGTQWETTAIPEIRQQAARIAAVVGGLVDGPAAPEPRSSSLGQEAR